MFRKLKALLSLVICISMLCTIMPITSYAAEGDAASVTFGGSTEYYSTIDAAWAAAVALDTAAENKATIKLLADCTAENTLTNTEDYLVLDTNGKTLTTPTANNQTSFTCGICVDGGSLELIGNGTVTGVSQSNYSKAILLINGGKVTANGITIHNTGTNGSNPVRIAGGEFYLLDGHLITDDEYALYADKGKVYLYSGTLETGRTARMVTVNGSGAEVQICYSEQPLYFVMRRAVWRIIDNTSYFHLEDNLVMDLEYSDNPDGSDSQMLRNVTQIDDVANEGRSYLKIQTYKPSYLFSTNYNDSLLKRAKNDGITTYSETEITAVHFVDLADYDLTNVVCSDYSAKGDGSVKAWMDGTELYIGGYRKIIAGKSLNCAFRDGKSINSITGLDLLDTSRTTDMGYVFNNCGYNSSEFTLDLGDNFDTSNATTMVYMFGSCGYNSTKFSLNLRDEFDTSKVTDMSYMFINCGRSCPTFTLDLGNRFDTSSVTTMYRMFERCGYSSTAFTTLDLSTFRVSANTNLRLFAEDIPVTKFIFGRGWRNATVAMPYNKFANSSSDTPTEIVGATKNLLSYDWASNNRTVTFTDNITYTITALAEGGGSVRGEGTVLDGESITLTAVPAPNGYSLEGWYEGDTKVCDTEEFVIEDASDDKTYTAKFIQTTPYYSILARVKDSGGQVSGGDDVPEGGSVTLIATPDAGYTFDGWYDGDAKVCETEEFVVNNVTADKTYTAKFTEKTAVVSKLFNTEYYGTLLNKIKYDGVTDVKEDEITGVHFVDLTDYDLTDITCSDYSASSDGSVKAWMDGTELYIGGYGKIIAGSSLVYAFRTGGKINSITGFEMLDTSNVTDMSQMFQSCGNHSTEFTLDLGNNFNTSNVIRMKDMFYGCGRESTKFTLNLGDNFDTSNVYDMSGLFHNCGYNSTVLALDLGEKFDTSNVINMSDMFNGCGAKSTVFTLDLGEKFDTSNVTNMKSMFRECGYSSTKFTISLGDKFDTSKVTDMSNMFYRFGDESDEFTLDLGDHFDTSNVENMTYMFYACGYRSPVFKLNFGNKFNTSKVTDMSSMFAYTGCYSKEFNLALDDRFDTSNVTSISAMFLGCGSESETFTLDLGNHFDTSKVIGSMALMFQGCGEASKVFTLDLGDKFDTSNVINMDNMFYRCGFKSNVFTLDLGDKFNTSKVTDMGRMFGYCGFNSTAFTTLDLSSFTIGAKTDLRSFATYSPVTEFIFGEGWANASLPTKNAFYSYDKVDTTVTGATKNLLNYNWTNDRRTVTFPDKNYYTITALADDGGTVTGGGTIVESSSITLTAAANDGYTFAGWYDGGTKVCDTAEFTVENVTEDKTYTAKFAKNAVSYTITALADDGGTVSGGGTVAEGGSITLTATADDGCTFAGWYDGNTKVCDTAEFTVENVTEDKTYTAKFIKNTVYYTITAEAGTEGGTVSGGGEVTEGGSITLTATANDGYTFDGWYDGNTKVCDTAEFTLSNITADKTYTARFTKNTIEPDPDPSAFDFTSLRTLKTKNITVNHETKTIDIDAADNTDCITIFVHQKDVIPGGTFKMASYLGNKVVYDKNGSYRVYYVHNFTVPVKGNITINGVTEQYLVNVHFDSSKAGFDFTSLKGKNFSDVTVNHDDKTVHITANDSADEITLYVNQHDTVYGGKLRMASYLGNKVNYNSASGLYTIYANNKSSVSVKANIEINGVTEQYLITVDFPAVSWGFDAVNAENVKNVSIDHENKVITMDTTEGTDSILLYIDQTCQSNLKGQIWMKSYMGNKVVYNAADRTYTITKKDKNSITVKTKITMLGETRYYDININFTENE